MERYIGVKSIPAFLSALALTTVIGCGRDADYYGQIDLVDVSGVIKLDGQPVEGAVVIFQDEQSSLEAYALTDASGKYRLRFDSEKHGVTPGKKIVMVSTTKKIPGLNTGEGEGGEEDGGEEGEGARKKAVDRIPKPYRGKKSVLRATVTSSNATMNFDLKSDGSTKGPE